MTYARRGLSGLGTVTFDQLLAQGFPNEAQELWPGQPLAQRRAMFNLQQQTPDGSTGNVDPQYASLVMHADGSIGPTSDAVLGSSTDPNNSSYAYWKGIIAANRYLLILNNQNQPVSSMGAISIPAAQAIIATYTPTPGSTTSQTVSTAATATAEQQAQAEARAAQASAPVTTTSQAPATPPPGTPVPTHTAAYLPYGTLVTLSNGQQAYADGHGGLIAGTPPGGGTRRLFDPSSIPPFSGDPLFPPEAILPTGPVDVNGNPVDHSGAPGTVPVLMAGMSSGTLWAIAAVGAFLLLRSGRRS